MYVGQYVKYGSNIMLANIYTLSRAYYVWNQAYNTRKETSETL